MQKNLEVKKTCHIFAIPKIKRSARITVSTQDSQSCNRSSILRPSTKNCLPLHRKKFLLPCRKYLLNISSFRPAGFVWTTRPDSLIFIRGFQSFSAVRTRSNMSKPCLQSKKLWLILTFLRKTLTPSRCKMFRLRASDRFQNPFFAR